MSDNPQRELTEQDKARIRLEEIFRHEVRKELDQRSESTWSRRFKALNQPFALWVLSTVVVGLLSFAYTNWRETQDARVASRDRAAQAQRELEYRTRQVDLVFREALIVGDACLNDVARSGGRIKGDRIRDYFEVATKISVVAQLGGIVQFPPPDQEGSATVWIGSSGYGYRHIPFKRGLRSEQFANDQLTDLVSQWRAATRMKPLDPAERGTIDDSLARFAAATKFPHLDILKDWFARHQATGNYKSLYGEAYRVYEVEVDDYADELKRVHDWVRAAEASWTTLKQLPTVKDAIGT